MNTNHSFRQVDQHIDRAKQGKKDIKITEFAHLFSISAETLRKYDSQEIMRASRLENDYRVYSSWDLTKLIRIRQLRSARHSLPEISALIRSGMDESSLEDIDKSIIDIKREIEEGHKLIHWLKRQKSIIIQTRQQGDSVMIEDMEAIHCCIYMVGPTLVDKEGKEKENLKQWMAALPFVTTYYLKSSGGKTVSCVGLTESERRIYGLEYLQADFVLPESRYGSCNIVTQRSHDFDYSSETLEESYQRISTLELALEDIILVRVDDYIQRGDVYSSYNHFMIPILPQ